MIKLEKIEVNGRLYEAEIGKIKSTFLGIEDHGILTFMVHVEFDGTGQGFGSYSLDGWDKKTDKLVGSPACAGIIRSILETVGVYSWEELPGKMVVVLRDKSYDLIRGITNLPPAKIKSTIFTEILEGN